MLFNMYAFMALISSYLTKIFLTAVLSPASGQNKSTCKHTRLTTFPKFEKP